MSLFPEQVVLCRACVVECTKFKSLYSYKFMFNGEQETTYAELLKFITDIEFSEYESPSLPQYICNHCIQQLLQAYNFRKKVLDADELLKFELEDDGIDRNKDQKQRAKVKNEKASYTNISTDSNLSEDSHPLPEVVKTDIERCQVNDTSDPLTEDFAENYVKSSESPQTVEEITDNEYEEENESHLEYESDVEVLQDPDTIKIEERSDAQTVEEITDNEYEESESQMEYESDSKVVQDADTIKIEERRKAQMLFESEREIRMHNAKQDIENPLEFKSYGEKVRAYIEGNKSHSQCNICGKRFTYKNSYKYHMQFHVEGRKCHICHKTLKTYNEYLGHISTHVPNKCDICGKLYRHASSLRTHMKTHTGELVVIKCQLCPKTFNKKWNYQQHMLTHQKHMVNNTDEETPYKCEYCGRAYSLEANLNYHRRKHCDMFKCVLCSQIFDSAKILKDHMKLHPYDY